MKHLGRFVLIKEGDMTSEGYILAKSSAHRMNGTFDIQDCCDGRNIGIAEVFGVDGIYYADIYERQHFSPKTPLLSLMESGRKNFCPQGFSLVANRLEVTSYQLTGILLNEQKDSNQQVYRYPISLTPDLKCSAFCSKNWFRIMPEF